MKRNLKSLFTPALVALMLVFTVLLPQRASAQAIGDYGENQIIDTIMRAQATSLGANVFIGLSTAACSDSSVGTEVSGGSYARVSVARSLANWAGTIRVKKDDIADDQYGQYGMRFQHMGRAVALHPDELVFKLLKDGFNQLCFDGQYFFDTDHPVGKPGSQVSVSNSMGGAGRPWVILDSKQMLKPVIFQEREAFNMVSRTDPESDNVFTRKEYEYGVDGRCNVGFGLWQLAVGSKQTLDLTNVKAAITQMRTFKKDNGQPLDLEPDTIVVAPEDAEAAKDLFSKELIANETNTLRNRLTVVSTGYFS